RGAHPSAAAALAVAGGAGGPGVGARQSVVLALGLARVAHEGSVTAREGRRFGERYELPGRYEIEMRAVRLRGVDVEGLLAHGRAHTASQHMAVVVLPLSERPAIDDRVLLVPARSFLPLVGGDGHAPELDALDGAPRLRTTCQDGDAVEAGLLKGGEEEIFPDGSRDTAAPEIRILLQMRRNVLVAHDVGDDGAAAAPEHAEDLGEEVRPILWTHEVEHAVGDDDVDRAVGNERPAAFRLDDLRLQADEVGLGADRLLAQHRVE